MRWRAAIDRMRAGIVAEKSAVWRPGGVASRMASRSSAKPMSSISSASSRISTSSLSSFSVPAANVIERAAGRSDDDVGAALEAADLLEHRGAAVERQHRQASAAGVLVHRLGDLHGELARRHEHEAVGAAPVLGAEGRDAVQHREREGRGLAGPRGRLGEEVAALEQQRNRFALHGRRLLVAERGDRRDDCLVEAERGESGGGGLGLGRRAFRHEAPLYCPGQSLVGSLQSSVTVLSPSRQSKVVSHSRESGNDGR